MVEVVKKKVLNKHRRKLLEAKLTRDSRGLLLYIKVHKIVETAIKNATGNKTAESNKWSSNGDVYKYYNLSDVRGDIISFWGNYLNEYGSQFIRAGQINTAILRTVGISSGKIFRVEAESSEETLIEAMKQLKKFVKDFYQQFIQRIKIDMTLTIGEV